MAGTNISPQPASDRLRELERARERRDRRAGESRVSPVSPVSGVARRGKSPQRPVRIPDDVWYPAVARSKQDGRPIGHVVAALLARYAAGELDA